jgi:hypothetical protein
VVFELKMLSWEMIPKFFEVFLQPQEELSKKADQKIGNYFLISRSDYPQNSYQIFDR